MVRSSAPDSQADAEGGDGWWRKMVGNPPMNASPRLVTHCQYCVTPEAPPPSRAVTWRLPHAPPAQRSISAAETVASFTPLKKSKHVLHKTSFRSCEGELNQCQQNSGFTRKMPVDGGVHQEPGRKRPSWWLRRGGSGAGGTHQPHQRSTKGANEPGQRRLRQHARSLQKQKKHWTCSQPVGLQAVCSWFPSWEKQRGELKKNKSLCGC